VDDKSETRYFNAITSIIHVYPLYKYLPATVYYIIYGVVCVVSLVSLVFVLVLLTDRKTTQKINGMTISLSHFTLFITGVGLVPFLGTLLTIYNCSDSKVKDFVCGTYTHVIMVILGSISILFLIPFDIISAVFYFHTTRSETDCMARKPTTVFAFEQFLKIILLILSIVGPNSLNTPWVVNGMIVFGYLYSLLVGINSGKLFLNKIADNVKIVVSIGMENL